MRLLVRASLRFLLRNPGQFVFALLGVAIGIAAVVAIDAAASSSKAAFSRTLETIQGAATHQLTAGSEGVPEALFVTLRREGFRGSAPVVERELRLLEPGVGVVKLLGVDIYAEGELRSWGGSGTQDSATRLVTEPGTIFLTEKRARALGLALNDELTVEAQATRKRLRLVGFLKVADQQSESALNSVALADLSTAQEVLGLNGRLSRIDLQLDSEREISKVQALLPPGVTLEGADAQRESLDQMTGAFFLNLQSLSLFAIVVGWFLIQNAMRFSVVRRRELFGRMRLLGVSEAQLRGVIYGEGLVVAIVGGILGTGIGWLLAQSLTDIIVKTLGDLYLNTEVSRVVLDPWTPIKVPLLSMGAGFLASYGPAREASRLEIRGTTLRSTIEASERRAAKRRWRLTLAGLALAMVLALLPGRSLLLAYAALFIILLSYSAFVPTLVLFASGILDRLTRAWGLIPRLAIRGIPQNLSRTGFAISALAVALSMSIGISVMVRSFRTSVVDWLQDQVRGDVFISLAGTVAREGNRQPLDPNFLKQIYSLEEFSGVHQNLNLDVRARGEELTLIIKDAIGTQDHQYRYVEGPSFDWTTARSESPPILVSEPLATHWGLELGEKVAIDTPGGPRQFTVVGVFRDFASDVGYAVMHRTVYRDYWSSPAVSSIAIFLKPGAQPEEVIRAVEAIAAEQLGDVSGLQMFASGELYENTLEIFDRTFRVTDVLKLIALLVAVVGVSGAFLNLQISRAREFAVLRAMGLTPRGLRQLIVGQGFVMACFAALFAYPLGVAFAFVLTELINVRSFGWSLSLNLSVYDLLEVLVLSVTAAFLGSIIPAISMARVPLETGLVLDE